MKKIAFAICVISLASCSSTSNIANLSNTVTKVSNITNTVTQINTLLGGLNLNSTQTAKVTSALTNYIQQYNTLSNIANTTDYQTKLGGYKTSALNEISSALGQSKYGSFINAAKEATKAKNSGLSAETINVLASLIN